jgi:hypothetical protein
VGPRPAGPMSQALMFFKSFKRMRLAHSSRKGLTRVIGSGTARRAAFCRRPGKS